MERNGFKEITEEHFKTCKKLIEAKGDCYAVNCCQCPFLETNAMNNKTCFDNGYSNLRNGRSKVIESAKEFLKFKQVDSPKPITINTKYGELRIYEDEKGAIKITYNTLKNVLVEMRSSNSLVFHTVQPYDNKIKTIGD